MQPPTQHTTTERGGAKATPALLSRRAVLGGSAAMLAFAACGNNDDTVGSSADASGDGATENAAPDSPVLVAPIPPEGFLAAGTPQRVPLQLRAPDGAPLSSVPGALVFTVSMVDGSTGTETVVEERIEVANRSDGVPLPYFPLRFTPTESGIYRIDAEFEGTPLTADVQVEDRDGVDVPQVGELMPAVASATAGATLGINPICTRDPHCPFHEVSFSDALAGGPALLLVSTPAFCQTAICGPVLDLLIGEAGNRGEVQFVHTEVYLDPMSGDPAAGGVAPTVEQLGLLYEPTLFLTNAAGVVVDRLDIIFDRSELLESLDAV